MAEKNYRWAVIGCGVIANELAAALEQRGRTLYAVSSRTQSKAEAFAQKYGIKNVYENSADLFSDPNIDIVYIATPHNTHMQFLNNALSNGKHVLCEKSITLNSDELQKAVSAAKENNRVLAEAMTIYHMPLYKRLRSIIDSGSLGALKMIQMNFGSYKEYDMANRFFCKELAGGALLDIGVYALSFVRWFMSKKPCSVLSQTALAPTGVDEQTTIILCNKKGEMASVSLSLHAKGPKRGMAAFDNGYIEIYTYPRANEATITYTSDNHIETIRAGETKDALLYEVDDMECAVYSLEASGNADIMHLDYTRDVMEIMTEVRRQSGIVYPEEVK